VIGLCVSALTGLAAPALWAQAPRSLIAQGGFEATTEGWESAQGAANLDGTQAHGGKSSVRLDGPALFQTPLIPYKQEFVRVSFWLKTQDVRRGPQFWNQAGGQVIWFDADRKPINHADMGLTLGTSDWTQHDGILYWEEAQEVAYFRVVMMLWDAQGRAWFDDVVVETAEPPEAFRKVPPLREVENSPSRVWPVPELKPATGPVNVGTMEVNFSPDRDFFIRPAEGHGPEITRVNVTLAGLAEPPGQEEAGYEAAEGYYYRHASRRASRTGYPVLEVYTEFFRNSPILSQFVRLFLANDTAVGQVEVSFRVPENLSRVTYFDVCTPRDTALADATVVLQPGQVSKPFVVLHDPEDSAGLVIYHPVPAEVRRWYVEDYVVESARPITCRFTPDGASQRVTWDFRDIAAGPGGYEHTFDFALFLMPYAGTVRDALAQFQVGNTDLMSDEPPLGREPPVSYWTEWMPGSPEGARLLRMARYHPREFASWIDAAHAGCYGHRLGHAWGAMTQQMKGIRVDPLAERALVRDHAFRMLQFFLERANEHGAPPDLSTWRELAAKLPDPEGYYSHVFCQYWEYRMGEFRRLMQSPNLTDPEKELVYRRLQRAAKLFDPKETRSWTTVLEGGGYWFQYMDLPLWPENPFVVNTHATSVAVAGEFSRLAQETGHPEDATWWADVFRRGVDGLLYALGQDWMWFGADHDENELRYARIGGGPRSYHTYMMTAWLPAVIRLAMEIDDYRTDDLLRYEHRLMLAKYLEQEPEALDTAKQFLASLGRK
jgi:hypothetical protein